MFLRSFVCCFVVLVVYFDQSKIGGEGKYHKTNFSSALTANWFTFALLFTNR